MPRPSRMVGDSHKSCKDCGGVLPLEAFSLGVCPHREMSEMTT